MHAETLRSITLKSVCDVGPTTYVTNAYIRIE